MNNFNVLITSLCFAFVVHIAVGGFWIDHQNPHPHSSGTTSHFQTKLIEISTGGKKLKSNRNMDKKWATIVKNGVVQLLAPLKTSPVPSADGRAGL